MTEIRPSRAQRRQLQKLADKIDRITQADRRFFERFPYRKFRVRIAGARGTATVSYKLDLAANHRQVVRRRLEREHDVWISRSD